MLTHWYLTQWDHLIGRYGVVKELGRILLLLLYSAQRQWYNWLESNHFLQKNNCFSFPPFLLSFTTNVRKPDTKLFIRQAIYLFQGRMSGCVLFLLACIHPVTSCRAGGIFHPSISLGSFGSSKQATPCMEARIMHAHLFYLGIDYFVYTNCLHIPPIHRHTIGWFIQSNPITQFKDSPEF